MRLPAVPLTAIAGLALLAGCEVRREGGDAEPAPSPTPTASESLSVTGEGEVEPTSIIRPEAAPVPVVDIPPNPLAATVPFPDGGYELDAAARRLLRSVIESEQAAEGWPIVLRGHTDSEGSDRGNLFASRKRAEAVAGWLVENGIAEARIEVIALGEQRPAAPNARLDGTPDEEGRRRNRRVEVWIGPPGSQPGDEFGQEREEDEEMAEDA